MISQGAMYASPFNIIYHGSHLNFERVEPHPNRRLRDGNVVWEGVAIFGTHDFRISLLYTHNISKNYMCGIDLVSYYREDEPIVYSVRGGETEEEALEALWGSFEESDDNWGWIYLLDGRKFVTEPGLGQMERITRDVSANIGKISINRREEIQNYVEKGLIIIDWSPKIWWH